ncbi:hypothetical protein B4110_2573 [Parageobacillus toebii]|uniref:Uncharacterized protein n=1 Tax=Parageobacillus toebii TaxID=153151 RepID=A0A150MN02_9BACL|nr:hypothetical protein B4110_2573 [Parageobacillus toebii]
MHVKGKRCMNLFSIVHDAFKFFSFLTKMDVSLYIYIE